MTKLLIFGIAPRPIDSLLFSSGPSNRTLQFVKPVSQKGHNLTVILLDSNKKTSGLSKADFSNHLGESAIIYNANYEDFTNLSDIKKIADDFNPDAIVGAASILPCFIASHLSHHYPFWADFFGCPISEIQSKSELYKNEQSDVELFHIWKMIKKILRTSDKFSAVSNRNRCALIGQLGLEGRLNRFTCDYEFIHTMPCAFDTDESSIDQQTFSKTKNLKSIIRGVKTNPDDFIILWSGSFNTWMDVETLFKGLEIAMKNNPKIKFVSTGAEISGYNEKSYYDFCQLVNNSKFKDKFLLMGWINSEEINHYYNECDLGINIDRFTYEGTLGSRNRIIQFLKNGLPVISTNITELTQDLIQLKYIHTFDIGNLGSLAEKILQLAQDKILLQRNISQAREFVISEYSFQNTTKDFLEWCEKPNFSPDKIEKFKRQPPNLFENVYLNETEKYSHFNADERNTINANISDKSSVLQKLKNYFFEILNHNKKNMERG